MSFATAAALNSEGIHLMSIGDHEGALRIFEKALAISQSLSGHATNSSNSDVRSWRPETIAFVSKISKNTSCPSFDRCFDVVLDPFCQGIPSKNEVELLIATVLYNVALSCQHEAFSRISQRSSYLETTVRIYHMAVDVLLNLNVSSDSLSLLLAMSNNMAFLALENLDYDSFDRYRGWMGCFLISQKLFHQNFFSGNFAATSTVKERPAAAA
eukprot:scaffold1390_cov172-Amphora_coffeaeformis.AAC.16